MMYKQIDNTSMACLMSVKDLKAKGAELNDFVQLNDKAADILENIMDIIERENGFWIKPGHELLPMDLISLPDGSLVVIFAQLNEEEIKSMEEEYSDFIDDDIDEDDIEEFEEVEDIDVQDEIKRFISEAAKVAEECNLNDVQVQEDKSTEVSELDIAYGFMYEVKKLDTACRAIKAIHSLVKGTVELYKDNKKECYIFHLKTEKGEANASAQNILAEYMKIIPYSGAYIQYLTEKNSVVLKETDLSKAALYM